MYVVVGASGNTGSVVAEKLLAKNQRVRVVGRDASKLEPFVNKGAEAFTSAWTDSEALTKALDGARAAYVLLPQDQQSPDFHAFGNKVADALAEAMDNAKVPRVVVLSSIGAGEENLRGPEADLHYWEQKLNAIQKLHALYLRAGFFFENLLFQMDTIKAFGLMAGAFRADLPLPQIATRDIAAFAAERLQALDFSGKHARELLGARDVSMSETARIIGKAIGQPELQYKQLPAEQVKQGIIQSGVAPDVARLIVILAEDTNAGRIAAREPPSPANTTPTTMETFLAEQFVPRFKGKSARA